MADEMGVSKKTIQNWEKGISSPNMFQGIEWFQILGLNINRYMMDYLYPEAMDESQESFEKNVTDALVSTINGMSCDHKKKLLYLMNGNHGSHWSVIFDVMTAYSQIPLNQKVLTAGLITDQFEMARANDQLLIEDHVEPDLNLIKRAINSAKHAVCSGQQTYSLDLSDLKSF